MALPSCLLLFVLNDIAEATIIHKSILLDLVTKNETIKKKHPSIFLLPHGT